jgi:hypothetical protein
MGFNIDLEAEMPHHGAGIAMNPIWKRTGFETRNCKVQSLALKFIPSVVWGLFISLFEHHCLKNYEVRIIKNHLRGLHWHLILVSQLSFRLSLNYLLEIPHFDIHSSITPEFGTRITSNFSLILDRAALQRITATHHSELVSHRGSTL